MPVCPQVRRPTRRQPGPRLPSSFRPPGVERLLLGALAGVLAWRAMDHTLQLLYDREAPEARAREDRARRGIPAMEVLADRLAGPPLTDDERQRGGTCLQWAMGIGAGVLYGALRDRLPARGLRRGLLYGVGFSLVVDELLTPALGLAPDPRAFPWQTHARGFAGHLVYGAAVEAAMEALTGLRGYYGGLPGRVGAGSRTPSRPARADGGVPSPSRPGRSRLRRRDPAAGVDGSAAPGRMSR